MSGRIAILYPKNDWTAADTALRLDAIASFKNLNGFIVPKYPNRDDESLIPKLGRSKYAIFLMFDKNILDTTTKQDISFLLERGAKVYCIIPHTSLNYFKNIFAQHASHSNNKNIVIISYYKGSKTDLENSINDILEEIKKKEEKVHKANRDMVMALVLTGLLLLVLSALSKNKK